MAKSQQFKTVKQITAIIKKYNNDPQREGDELEILIMAGSKSITLAQMYREMVKRFDKVDNRLDKQEEWNKKQEKELASLKNDVIQLKEDVGQIKQDYVQLKEDLANLKKDNNLK